MIQRRLRGLFAVITGGAVTGGIAGAVFGLIILLSPGPKVVTIHPQFPGAIVVLPALLLGLAGAIGGGVFGTLVMLAERGRGVEAIRTRRVALWAAIASAPAIRLVGWSWTTVVLGSIVSAAIGAAAIWIAKRGRTGQIAVELNAPPT
jgi:hypothetical protein